ncbi:IS3 family transposase, partial [Sulfobacillus harzensis]|nr:IS3 family transposase [Sulfobacillus harzensis]
MLQVSRSGYYAWRDRPPSPRALRRAERRAQIQTIFANSRGRYGSPKITAVLRQTGERIAQKTVARLMREAGLRSRVVRKYKATTHSRHAHPVADNLLNR